MRIEPVLDYIWKQFETSACEKQQVTVESVATEFHVSPRRLEILFENQLYSRMTPKEYIQFIQFLHVEIFIYYEPNIPLKALLPKLGIHSRKTISLLYKKFCKTTFKEHQKNKRNKVDRLLLLTKQCYSGLGTK